MDTSSFFTGTFATKKTADAIARRTASSGGVKFWKRAKKSLTNFINSI